MSELKNDAIRDIKTFFKEEYDCEVVDVYKCGMYLKDNGYIYSYEDIIKRYCECHGINCPIEFLNCDRIFNVVSDSYTGIGKKYLDCDEFDGFDGIGDMYDKELVIDCELLDKICDKYDVTYDEVFKNISKYSSETFE